MAYPINYQLPLDYELMTDLDENNNLECVIVNPNDCFYTEYNGYDYPSDNQSPLNFGD